MAIADNVARILGELPVDVTLVVAVKYANEEQIKELIRVGIKDLGFNTLQQLEELKVSLPHYVKIHFIGHLQKNKVKKLLEFNPFLIQSVDSYALAEKINTICENLGKEQTILLQAKTDEEKEFGINIKELSSLALKISQKLPHLIIEGLMTIPSVDKDKAILYFELMKKEYDKLEILLERKLKFLSMGMSEDYLLAIDEGANMVRIGRKIFDLR